jgi:hypothetical protein
MKDEFRIEMMNHRLNGPMAALSLFSSFFIHPSSFFYFTDR